MTPIALMVCGFAAMGGAIVALRRWRRVVVPRDRRWLAVPIDVWIHVDIADLMPDVAFAIDRWHDALGVAVFETPTLLVNSGTAPITGIWIHPSGSLPEGKVARTTREPSGGPIRRAEIAIGPLVRPGDLTANVMAHELGHALGYGHPVNPPRGHVMARSFERMGWRFDGIG